jgi:sulfite dehydrogenase
VLILALSGGHKLGLGIVAGAFILFALLTSMVIPRFRPDFPGKNGVRLYVLAALVFFVGTLAAVEGFAKEEPEGEAGAHGGESAGKPSGGPSPAVVAAGKKVFLSAGCVACHTLKDAKATGNVGPNLDQAKPPKALVVDRVTNGKGAMPPFKGQLSAQQIDAVATYVSSVAGKSG